VAAALCMSTATVVSVAPAPAGADGRSQALYARGLIPFHTGMWDAALELFDQAVNADPEDALALYYRGLTRARRGEGTAAIEDLLRAVELDPDLPHAALDLGIAYFDLGRFANAKTWLQRAHEQGYERSTAAFFLGITMYRLEDYPTAQRFLEEAKGDPELTAAAHYYLGLIRLEEGNDADARTQFSQTARQAPDTELGTLAGRYLAGDRAPAAPRATKRWRISLGSRFEYDSNVVLGPSDGPSAVSEDGDGRFSFTAGGAYTLLDGELGTVDAAYDFYQSVHFDLREFDLQGHRVRVDAMSRPDRLTYGIGTTYDFYALDYSSFYQQVMTMPWAAWAWTDALVTEVYYRFRFRDFLRYPFDPFRDGFNHAFGGRQHVLFEPAGVSLSAGYRFENEELEDTNSKDLVIRSGTRDFEANAHQLDFEAAFPVFEIFRGHVGYQLRLEDYEFNNSRTVVLDPVTGAVLSTGKKRDDTEHNFVVAFERDVSERTVVNIAYLGTLGDSNIDEFEYDRHIVSVGLQVNF
jgi:tetratricopeptide (TPR) repeat protein